MKELREDRRPADLWFWNDWFSSFDVRSCSLAAQGLWVNMLGIMSRSETKGVLSINGKPLDSKDIAKIVGVFKDEVEKLLVELEYFKVFSRLEDGTIINRRMFRESQLSQERSKAGKLGASLRWQTDSKPVTTGDGKPIATLESDNEDEVLLDDKEKIKILWCEFAERFGLAAIKDIPKGSKRERALNARLADKSFDFKALLHEIGQSPFLLGKKTDFKATFDWIIAPSNYQKIIEGNYRGASPLDGPKKWLEEQEKKDGGK